MDSEAVRKGRKGFTESDWCGDEESSLVRAFNEGRLEWLCSHVFYMDNGLPIHVFRLEAGSCRQVVCGEGRSTLVNTPQE